MPRKSLLRHALVAGCVLFIAACQMPRMPGTGGYYQVTDTASGTVYYTSNLRRESRGVVEFRDGRSGAWVSIAGAEVESISRDEYRAQSAH